MTAPASKICRNGHARTPANTGRTSRGGVACLICRAAALRRYAATALGIACNARRTAKYRASAKWIVTKAAQSGRYAAWVRTPAGAKYNREQAAKSRRRLTRNYIATALRMPNAPPELIALKRAHLKAIRLLKSKVR